MAYNLTRTKIFSSVLTSDHSIYLATGILSPVRVTMILRVTTSCWLCVTLTLFQDEFCLEPSPKVFLQNKHARSWTKLQELESVLNGKREKCILVNVKMMSHTLTGNEAAKYVDLIASYSADNALANIDDAVNVLSFCCLWCIFIANLLSVGLSRRPTPSNILRNIGARPPHRNRYYCSSAWW